MSRIRTRDLKLKGLPPLEPLTQTMKKNKDNTSSITTTTTTTESQTILLYSSRAAMPNRLRPPKMTKHPSNSEGIKNALLLSSSLFRHGGGTAWRSSMNSFLPLFSENDANQALENCDFLTILLSPARGAGNKQCYALVPQKSTAPFTLHYGRIATTTNQSNKGNHHASSSAKMTTQQQPPAQLVVNASLPLRPMGRNVLRGRDYFAIPTATTTTTKPNDNNGTEQEERIFSLHWHVLTQFTRFRDQIKSELLPLLQQAAFHLPQHNKNENHNDSDSAIVIIMTCNWGQADLLVNWVCSVRARAAAATPGLLLSLLLQHVVVLALDEATHQLCQQHLGLKSYYHSKLYSHVPAVIAGSNGDDEEVRYGSTHYGLIVVSKIMAAYLVSDLKFDFIFQDVDLIWYQNPLEYFVTHYYQQLENTHINNDDNDVVEFVFQDDPNRENLRFAPFYGNTGVYFCRNTPRTRHFWTFMVATGALTVLRFNSDQAATNQGLAYYAMQYGMRIQTLSSSLTTTSSSSSSMDDGLLFLGGRHYNYPTAASLAAFEAGRTTVMAGGIGKSADGKSNNYSIRSGATAAAAVSPILFHNFWTPNKRVKIERFRQLGEWRLRGGGMACIDEHLNKTNHENTDMLSSSLSLGSKDKNTVVQACCSVKPIDWACFHPGKPSLHPC